MIKKTVRSLLISIICLLGLTACGDDEQVNKKQTEKQQENQQTTEESSDNKTSKMHKLPTFVYKNNEYNFSLEIPETWKGKFTVSKSNWNPDAEATFDFKFRNGGYLLFSIIVLPVDEKTWETQFSGSIWQYLGTNSNQKTFAFVPIQQFPEGLDKKDPKKIEQYAYFSHMVNVDVPKISQTFEYY